MSPAATTTRPSTSALAHGLGRLLAADGQARVRVLERSAADHAHRDRSEVVTCLLPDGKTARVFCKYEDAAAPPWSAVAYEAEVYREAVGPSGLPAPRFRGTHVEKSSRRLWLVLDYIEGAISLHEIGLPEPLELAASWIGRFHRIGSELLATGALGFLHRHGSAHYADKARRMLLNAGDRAGEFPWLAAFERRFASETAARIEGHLTVAHGDFHAFNLVKLDDTVYPLDWECAAADLGEVDLAELVDGWEEETRAACMAVYARARWPEGAPADFAERMDLAGVCLHVHQLGNLPGWPGDAEGLRSAGELEALARRLGLA